MNSRPLFIPLLGAILGLSLAGLYPVTVPVWGLTALLLLTFAAIFTPTHVPSSFSSSSFLPFFGGFVPFSRF